MSSPQIQPQICPILEKPSSDEGNAGGFSNSKAPRERFAEHYDFSATNTSIRDEETGFGYFGARYMDHELMTMWLSVDPMANKYPGISPYNYCVWTRPTGGDEHRWIKYNIVNNPVKLVDPDGMEWKKISDHTTANHIREAIVETIRCNNAIINRLQKRLDRGNPNSTRANKLSQNISELQAQNGLLDDLATGLDNMEKDPLTIVTFTGSNEVYNQTSWDGQISEGDYRNHITIRFQNNNMGSLIHESVHGYLFGKTKNLSNSIQSLMRRFWLTKRNIASVHGICRAQGQEVLLLTRPPVICQ